MGVIALVEFLGIPIDPLPLILCLQQYGLRRHNGCVCVEGAFKFLKETENAQDGGRWCRR